jgi:hypothetical protein
MRVLDTTATPEFPKRVHEMIVDRILKSFTFEHGKGLEMPREIALKFLKWEAFKLVDAKGNVLDYQRRPKQPEELQAGEALTLADNETVARYDELSNGALQARVLELPGGEQFAVNPSRDAIIRFIVAHKQKIAATNRSRESDLAMGETDVVASEAFVPEYEDADAA